MIPFVILTDNLKDVAALGYPSDRAWLPGRPEVRGRGKTENGAIGSLFRQLAKSKRNGLSIRRGDLRAEFAAKPTGGAA